MVPTLRCAGKRSSWPDFAGYVEDGRQTRADEVNSQNSALSHRAIVRPVIWKVMLDRTRCLSIQFLLLLLTCVGLSAQAAQGNMGTGIPHFGLYSAATGQMAVVWSLGAATIPIPAECPKLLLTPATMGTDAYKAAVATLMAAKLAARPVRFYSHAPRDGGCGVNYVELN